MIFFTRKGVPRGCRHEIRQTRGPFTIRLNDVEKPLGPKKRDVHTAKKLLFGFYMSLNQDMFQLYIMHIMHLSMV